MCVTKKCIENREQAKVYVYFKTKRIIRPNMDQICVSYVELLVLISLSYVQQF